MRNIITRSCIAMLILLIFAVPALAAERQAAHRAVPACHRELATAGRFGAGPAGEED